MTFKEDGSAEEIPPYYVPQAYRDWDLQLYDWQVQCSMLANEKGLQYVTRRLMPTVGCEADAIAFEEQRQVCVCLRACVRGFVQRACMCVCLCVLGGCVWRCGWAGRRVGR